MSRSVYKAVIYVEKTDEHGNIRLERVTTTQWITVPMIAASVGVAPQTMYNLILNNKAMPHYRINSQIRVRSEDYAEWLEKCRDAEYERPGAK